MNLHQEYINRKGYKVPVVLYKPETYVLLESNNKNNVWKIFYAQWQKEKSSLGIYKVKIFESIPNGWKAGSMGFSSCFSELESSFWEWDEYEKNIFNFVKEIKKERIYKAVDQKTISLCLWRMFLTVAEDYLIDIFDINYLLNISCTLDKNILSTEDLNKINKFIDKIKNKDSFLFDFWKINFFYKINSNIDSQWLVEILNG